MYRNPSKVYLFGALRHLRQICLPTLALRARDNIVDSAVARPKASMNRAVGSDLLVDLDCQARLTTLRLQYTEYSTLETQPILSMLQFSLHL